MTLHWVRHGWSHIEVLHVTYTVKYMYVGLLKSIQKNYDHSPNTTVRLARNEIIGRVSTEKRFNRIIYNLVGNIEILLSEANR